jgi:Stage II sporulation protein E (SpoIIE)
MQLGDQQLQPFDLLVSRGQLCVFQKVVLRPGKEFVRAARRSGPSMLRAVGGDYYDFLQLGPQHVGLVLGDVSGKGISAAAIASALPAARAARVDVTQALRSDYFLGMAIS